MKLTPELITRSDSTISTLRDRELDLRGHKIPAIENLGVTQDQNDCLDLTDNDIRALTNFPVLKRLHTLIASNNVISRIDHRFANSLPRLTTLVLTNNALSDLSALDPLGRLPLLEYLTLQGNPVSRKKHYREYVIWRCKKVRVLDFQRVKQKEREMAKQLMETADGRPSALAASLSAAGQLPKEGAGTNGVAVPVSKTFEPGAGLANGGDVGGTKNGPRAGARFTAAERKALEEAIERSSSLEEIKKLEDRLRLGYSVTTTDSMQE